MNLRDLATLVAIVDKRGMGAAGRELGMSATTVSERLAALEAHYGAKLLNRTTRSHSLTEEGRVLVEGARRLLGDAADLEVRVRDGAEQISGLLRISAPIDIGRTRIVPLLDAFMAKHPLVRIDLQLSDGYVDILGGTIDAAIRFGNLKDSALVARRLGTNKRVLCASPAYVKRHGAPKHPSELEAHNCLRMRFGDAVDQDWSFVVDGKTRTYTVRGSRIANDSELVRKWCLQGHGIALKSLWDVGPDIARGKLVALLPKHPPTPYNLQIVYAGAQHAPRRVTALVEHLARELGRAEL